MVSELLPECVACEEIVGDPEPAGLMPEEEAAIARAVEKRRREFGLGRQCARAALARLGMPPVAIPQGPKRQPLWPAGVVGSITHCAGYCAAAVARSADVAGVGIDAEVRSRKLGDGVVERVTIPEEREWIARQPADGTPWEMIVFSAKESVYKAWFPMTGAWLGFEDARIEIGPEGKFIARLAKRGMSYRGRYRVAGLWVMTAVVQLY